MLIRYTILECVCVHVKWSVCVWYTYWLLLAIDLVLKNIHNATPGHLDELVCVGKRRGLLACKPTRGSRPQRNSEMKGYCPGTWIEGSEYLHIWDSMSSQYLSAGCLTVQLEGKAVQSNKLLDIFQSHSFCTFLTVQVSAQVSYMRLIQIKRVANKRNHNLSDDVYHCSHSPACQDVSDMNKSIEHFCSWFNQFILFLAKHIAYKQSLWMLNQKTKKVLSWKMDQKGKQ